MKKLYVLSLLLAVSGAVFAQDVIYRCGNEYTNNVAQAKAKGCKPVDGGGVTVIHGTRSSGSSSSAGTTAAPAKPKPAPEKEKAVKVKETLQVIKIKEIKEIQTLKRY